MRRRIKKKSNCSRVVFIILGIFFGFLGVHNFYAGRIAVGVCQLALSIFLAVTVIGLLLLPFICLWCLIEAVVVTCDGKGLEMNR